MIGRDYVGMPPARASAMDWFSTAKKKAAKETQHETTGTGDGIEAKLREHSRGTIFLFSYSLQGYIADQARQSLKKSHRALQG